MNHDFIWSCLLHKSYVAQHKTQQPISFIGSSGTRMRMHHVASCPPWLKAVPCGTSSTMPFRLCGNQSLPRATNESSQIHQRHNVREPMEEGPVHEQRPHRGHIESHGMDKWTYCLLRTTGRHIPNEYKLNVKVDKHDKKAAYKPNRHKWSFKNYRMGIILTGV